MSECINCSRVEPIEDEGYVWLQPSLAFPQEKLNGLRHLAPNEAVGSSTTYSAAFDRKEALLDILETLQKMCSGDESRELRMLINAKPELDPLENRWLDLGTYFARMQHHDLVTVIQDKRFASHMQPIVSVDSQTVYGYEFLLRPAPDGKPFQPYQLFEAAQQTGLHSFLDRAARISAIETSHLHLPKGMKRFINFLPSSIYNPNFCLSHTFAAIQRLELDPGDFVFEVVETENIVSIDHLRNIFAVYKQAGIQVALDDVGAGYSTVEVLQELQPDYVKIDRALIDGCDRDASKQSKILHIVEASSSFGGQVLAEGMERPEEWEFCKAAGIPLAQGYFIGKPAAAPLASTHLAIG